VGMAPKEECVSEMFVRLRWRGANLVVPLSQWKPLAADPKLRRPLRIGIIGSAAVMNSEVLVRYRICKVEILERWT